MLLVILFWITAATWLTVVVASAAGVALLPSLPALTTPVDRASVSVIIPVRDESASVQTTADRLRQQQDVDLEIIFVNDRSADGTGDILDRLSDLDANIRVIHIETLPDGWLGKCHALHVGASAARGGWILFVDGDSNLFLETRGFVRSRCFGGFFDIADLCGLIGYRLSRRRFRAQQDAN